MLFIKDATLANSELIQVKSWADADYYTATRNLINTHENTADLLNGVYEAVFNLPDGVRYVNVTFTNADDDANYAVRVDYGNITT